MNPSTPQPHAVNLEEVSTEIVAPVLGLARIGADDDFFNHDATSLHLVRMAAAALQRYGVELSLPDLFDEPTAAGLARLIGQELDEDHPVSG